MSTIADRSAGGSLVLNAIIGGLIGAVVVDAYLITTMHAQPVGFWQFVASVQVGKVAFTSPSYAVLGLALHIVTSLIWAFAYAYVWRAVNTLRNWITGAIVLGIVADIVMALFLAMHGVPFPLAPQAILTGLITHIVFFAAPTTWWLSRSMSRA